MSDTQLPETELPPRTDLPERGGRCADFRDAWEKGQRPHIEDFLSGTRPEECPALLRELIHLDAAYRRQQGETPRPEDYRERFPALDPIWLADLLGGPTPGEAELTCSTAATAGRAGPALRCPHCHNSLPFAAAAHSLLCPACGSSFRIAQVEEVSTADEIRVLGRFHLLERVGQGSFGAVWRARDTELDRVIALKIPHAGLLAAAGYLERFRREARAAAQLRHPGIVRLYEVVTAAGVPVLVSDFIEGVPLKDLVEVRRLTFREAAQVVAEVADALDYSHGVGLVHRDIKPGNIMMEYPRRPEAPAARPPAVGRPVVVDFGLALRDEAEIVMTAEGQVIGTPAYMSPEQAAGQGHRVDGRSDVYSLGVVLYQLLTGELPFRGSKAMLVHQVLREEPRPPRRVNDKIPRDLETICLKAMAKQPAWRYATARALAEDLRRFLRGEPIQARPVGRAERVWRWCRRNPALAVTGAVAVAALLAAVLLSVGLNVQQARALRESRTFAATLALDKGLSQCEQGNVGPGLLWLARGLEVAPDGAEDLRRTLRTNLAAWGQWLSPLRAPLPHGDGVLAVALSADGKAALTGGFDKTARLWDTTTGLPLGPALAHEDSVQAVAFSPDGKWVATASGRAAHLWDTVTGQRLASLPHKERVYGVAFSPDGQTLVTGCGDRAAHLWDLPSRAHRAALKHQGKGAVQAVAFSPDGRTVLSVSRDRTARLWDTGTGNEARITVTHDELLMAAFTPDGKFFVTAGRSRIVRLWDVGTGALVRSITHPAEVLSLAVSPDGRLLLTGSADHTARLWELATGRAFGPPLVYPQRVTAVAFGPEGRLMLTTGDEKGAQIREVFPGALRHTLAVPKEAVRVVAFRHDGRVVLTGGGDFSSKRGSVRLWRTADGQPAAPPALHPGLVLTAAFRPDGGAVLTGATDGRARLVNAATGQPLCPPLAHTGWVRAVGFSADGRHALTASDDGTAGLWDAQTGRSLASFRHSAVVLAAAFSPDGRRLLTGTQDRNAALWDVAGRERLHTLTHPGMVEVVAFSPDGTVALTAGADKTARLWLVATGRPLGEPLRHQDTVTAVAFSPDGKIVLTGSGDRTARLWDVATGKPQGPPLIHQGRVYAVAFHPTRPVVLTASQDCTARLWDAGTGKPLGPALVHDREVVCAAFGPDGSVFATGSEDHAARLWEMPAVLPGGPGAVRLWAEALTGLELDPHDGVRNLEPEVWRGRRRRLRDSGGPPAP